MSAATLYVVATPIGNLGDISERLRATLSEVQRVVCEDSRTAQKLLSHLQLRKPLISLHDFNEAARLEGLLAWLRAGESLALISEAGTPCISDPGYRLVEACLNAGLKVVPIPGPSAVAAALSAAGLPADSYLFLGFLARKGAERRQALQQIVTSPHTSVFFESPQRIRATLEELAEAGASGRRATLCRELTKLHEQILQVRLGETPLEQLKELGEYVVVVEAAGESDRESRMRRRYEFLHQEMGVDEKTAIKIIAAEFDVNPKRLHYLFVEKP